MKLENIKIVMVETTHPGNIGAAARAMGNMQLGQLVLVNPLCSIDANAYARASGANGILDHRITVKNLPEAIADCELVVGTSARLRSLAWPELNPEKLAKKIIDLPDQQNAAVVFGRENSGLTNEELKFCNYTVTIPTNPHFSSLNVAAAIQVISYEIFKKAQDNQMPVVTAESGGLASSAELEGYFQHLEQVLVSTGFLDQDNPRQMMKRLRRLYLRALPDKNEVNILRGILSAVEKYKK